MPNDLLSKLRGRIKRFLDDGDRDAILSAETSALAESLLKSPLPDRGEELEVFHTLGWFYWCLYLLLPDGKDQVVGDAALELFEPVYRVSPDAVPEQVRR